MSPDNFSIIFNQHLRQVGLKIKLSSQQEEKFRFYLSLLKQWNQKINLTSLKKDEDIIIYHFIDSLAVSLVFPPAKQFLNCLDIGSGAGFPGVPLKICFPELRFTLVESKRKKASFLYLLNQEMNLDLEIIPFRAEMLLKDEKYKQKFDLVVARALGKLETIIPLCLPFLSQSGIFVSQKGPQIEKEISESYDIIKKQGAKIKEIRKYSLGNRERNLVVINRE